MVLLLVVGIVWLCVSDCNVWVVVCLVGNVDFMCVCYCFVLCGVGNDSVDIGYFG